MSWSVRAVAADDAEAVAAHLDRHAAESGRDEMHFMPYAPGADRGPSLPDVERLARPHEATGWERWYAVFVDDGRAVGHVRLRGGELETAMHRVELGTVRDRFRCCRRP